MATRVSYPVEIKMRAIEMRLAGVPVREVMSELGIRNETQLMTWMRWYRAGELHRLEQCQWANSTALAKIQSTSRKQRNYVQRFGF